MYVNIGAGAKKETTISCFEKTSCLHWFAHLQKKPSWVGDIAYALYCLPFPVVLKPVHLTDPNLIPDLIAEVEVLCACALQRDIDELEKTILLKKGIANPAALKLSDVLKFWHYLDVVVPAHCKALM
ncbi:uncharacterized protein LACBIDRAFT_334733 [Laccaria bicolor S238N-H82]|uniref:Predicted protein n=1 Tax=Laccaria bicolor (strain S238N-H82 / ATCC MYA-4686) TaxID=486041 RepID=B0E035_LACBS|nr:uncharacterized protein LACBIDRAFT_334733 [Laccaria bicolor S238N-H82]EDQ99831.1 predicted protein [Laccaria bicolor S238N-H82]|eukprot:XP_001889523.1 predicted protein [Laccaria bicolor S238N-H82]